MKGSAIKEIFYGAKGNKETMVLTKEIKNNIKSISEYYDKLKKSCSAKQMKLIEKFLDVYDNSLCDEINFYFTEGFKLGLRIGVECFEED